MYIQAQECTCNMCIFICVTVTECVLVTVQNLDRGFSGYLPDKGKAIAIYSQPYRYVDRHRYIIIDMYRDSQE